MNYNRQSKNKHRNYMDPWYETSCPSESDVEIYMQNSHIYICLREETNDTQENKYLCQIVSNSLSKERENLKPLDETIARNAHIYTQVRYETMRQHPRWKELIQQILKEEVILHKPYGSRRGFSTFVAGPLRQKFIVRLIREIWAVQVIQSKFVPLWLEHNYCPTGKGYERTSKHYYSLL